MKLQTSYVNHSALIGAFFVVIDMVVKQFLFSNYRDWVVVNTALAFGRGRGELLTVGIGMLLVVAYLTRLKPRFVWLALALAIFSNVVDRLLYGGVVDYIPFFLIYVNLSDVVICLSAAALIVQVTTKKDVV